jgi:glycosyltransferase involved in cell wall biosynthesis
VRRLNRVGIHAEPATHRIAGGVGAYVKHLVSELVSDGEWDFSLIVANQCLTPRDWSTKGTVPARLPVPVRYGLWNYLGVPRIRHELDVVHATGLAIPPAPNAALVATVHDLAVEHMPEVIPPLWRAIYRRGLRTAVSRAAVICAVSDAVKRELMDRFDVGEERIRVTPEAPCLSIEDPRDERVLERLGLDRPYILNVGTVEPRKNQTHLLRALAITDELKDVKLAIAGASGWGRRQVLEEIARLNLENRVVLTGQVTSEELAALYSRALAFAFPSLYEGFGIPLVEALSFGIPSVASSIPALIEVGGPAAVYVEPDDAEQLSGVLAELAQDPVLRARLAADGPAQAARFSWKATAELTRAAYRQAVSQTGQNS